MPAGETVPACYRSMARIASAAAADRVSTPSFSNIRSRCFCTVRGLMLRTSLISMLDFP